MSVSKGLGGVVVRCTIIVQRQHQGYDKTYDREGKEKEKTRDFSRAFPYAWRLGGSNP